MKVKGYQIFYAQVVIMILLLTLGFVASGITFVVLTGSYNGELGEPLTYFLGFPVYQPFAFAEWFVSFSEYFQTEIWQAAIPLLGSVIFAAMVTVWLSIVRHREDGESDSFGTSRWATDKEIKQSELVFDEGRLRGLKKLNKSKLEKAMDEFYHPIVLGKLEDGTLLRHSGPQHAAVCAPSRSEKGVGIVIPTLFSYMDSVIVADIKKENWFATSGFRSQFSHCICFDPTDPLSAQWNPLLEIRKGDRYEVRDTQNVANVLVDPEGEKNKFDHWETSALSLFTATILHVLYAEEDKSLTGMVYFLSDPSRHLRQTLELMMMTPHLGGKPHPVVASIAREMANRSPNELSSVMSTAMGFLTLYRDPTVAKVTSGCDFKVMDIVESEKPVSLYLVIPPSDLQRTRPLIRLLLNMALGKMAEKPLRPGATNKPYKHRLLCLLDELPALGKMSFLETSLGFLAGYGIRMLFIFQTLSQLEDKYKSLLDACHITVFYTPNPQDEKSAERISKMLGDATNERRNSMFSGGRIAVWLRNVTVSSQEMGRRLLTPGEILQFSADQLILLVSGLYPIKANKIRYYSDPIFKPRMLPDPELTESYNDYPPQGVMDWDGHVLERPSLSIEEDEPDEEGGLENEVQQPAGEGKPLDQFQQYEVVDRGTGEVTQKSEDGQEVFEQYAKKQAFERQQERRDEKEQAKEQEQQNEHSRGGRDDGIIW